MEYVKVGPERNRKQGRSWWQANKWDKYDLRNWVLGAVDGGGLSWEIWAAISPMEFPEEVSEKPDRQETKPGWQVVDILDGILRFAEWAMELASPR